MSLLRLRDLAHPKCWRIYLKGVIWQLPGKQFLKVLL